MKEIASSWFHSYLTIRGFLALLDNVFLQVGTINCGNTQRYILEPLYVLLCIDDNPQALTNNHIYLHADNTGIFINIRTLGKLKMVLKRNLQICEKGLLIISCPFILVKTKLNTFFSVGKKPVRT